MVARLVAVSALTLTLLVPTLSAGAVQGRGGLYHCRMAATPFPDRITVRYPDAAHEFPPEIRRASYEFLDRHLKK